jgi:hypothetical protein
MDICVFASKVELTSILTTYTDDQWQDDGFVKKVWRTCKSNREYFEYDFAELLHRYIRLLDESEKSKNCLVDQNGTLEDNN